MLPDFQEKPDYCIPIFWKRTIEQNPLWGDTWWEVTRIAHEMAISLRMPIAVQ